jgi:hypothetical protein
VGHPAARNGASRRHSFTLRASDDDAPRVGAAATAILATNFAAYIADENGRVAARLRREHRTRNMTICRSVPADFCLRLAVQAQASDARQTSPVSASSERPTDASNSLTAKVIEILRAARLQFLPCFSGENTGETGALAPLFAASVGVSRARTKLACVSSAGKAMTLPRLHGVEQGGCDLKPRRRVMSRPSLPARSLRGRPASLRTVPDGARGLLRKRLIWRALLVIRPAISGVEPIFLPALRESEGD